MLAMLNDLNERTYRMTLFFPTRFVFCLGIAISSLGISTPSIAAPIRPAKDLGEEVMKPMNEMFKTVMANINDGAQNTNSVGLLSRINGLVSIAIVSTPDTKAYKNEMALVGNDNTRIKYQSLLRALKVTVAELSQTLKNSGARVCGEPCKTILNEVQNLESVGHASFRDVE